MRAKASCRFPLANPAGIQMTPVRKKAKQQIGFRPQRSIKRITNTYAGISVNAADIVETYAFVPNLLDAIEIP